MSNPWERLPPQPPYVLDVDRALVDALNRSASPDQTVHLEHLPEPYLGRPDASVVLLGLNPGHKAEDDRWHADPSFIARARANLVHGPLAYPFYLLDPAQPCPGHRWWARALRQLTAATSLEAVAHAVLCVEYFPYHSRTYAHDAVRLPSQLYGFRLVEDAIARRAEFVLLRAEARWLRAVPALTGYDRLYRVRNVRRPTISEGNLPDGFDQLVRVVRDAMPTGRPA